MSGLEVTAMDVFLNVLQQCSPILVAYMELTDVGHMIDAIRCIELDQDNTQYWIKVIQKSLPFNTLLSIEAILERFNKTLPTYPSQCKSYFHYFSKPTDLCVIRLDINTITCKKNNNINCHNCNNINNKNIHNVDQIATVEQILINENVFECDNNNNDNINSINSINDVSEFDPSRYPKSKIIPKLKNECVIKFTHQEHHDRDPNQEKRVILNTDGSRKYPEYDIQIGVKIGDIRSDIKECCMFLLENGQKRTFAYEKNKCADAADFLFGKVFLSHVFDATIITSFDKLDEKAWYRSSGLKEYTQNVYWIPMIDPTFVLAFTI